MRLTGGLSSSRMNRWMNRRRECASGGRRPDATAKTFGLCDTARRAPYPDPACLLRRIVASPCCGSHLCCARILLSVLQTLLHGAFQWLQPRSPVVVVVERGRGPNPPDGRADGVRSPAGNGRALASLQAPESRRGGIAEEKLLRAARARDVGPLPGKRAVAGLVAGNSHPWLA